MNAKMEKHFGSKPVVWVAAWGLSKLRKRAGRFAGGIEGEALWYDAWYDRVFSVETADKLADLGVNLVILPFSLGGQAHTEQAERDDFERMAGVLHARGIVTLPYLQYQNILQETFEFENTMWGLHLNGTRKQFAYWRRTVCQSSPQFRGYFKALIGEAIARGGDGVWIDNTHLAPCRCEDCQQRFKAWLAENRRELLEELYLDDFERIEMPATVVATFDPIVRALMEFNLQRNLDILRELKAHLESCREDALFASNPGLYRGNSTEHLYGKGIDFRAMVGLHDLMYLENKFFPAESDGQTTGNYHGCISCEACGALAIPGGWKRDDFDSTEGAIGVHASGFPSTAEEIRRALFEDAAFGGALGMLWAIRARPERMCDSEADLMTLYLEHPVIADATRKTLAFLHSLPVFGATRNLAEIAVLRHRESLAYTGDRSWPNVHAAEELLLRAGMPYNVLFSEDVAEQAGAYKLIVLPEVAVLSDGDAEQITRYVEAGGRIVVLGNAGIYTENMRTRKEFALKELTGVSRFHRGDDITVRAAGQGQSACLALNGFTQTPIQNTRQGDPTMVWPRWIEHKEAILESMDRMLGADRQVRVESPAGTAVSLRSTADGRTALHVLAYRMHSEPTEVRLTLRKDLAGELEGEWHTPDDGKQSPVMQGDGNGPVRVTLPGFRDYGVLILSP